jgi:transformation/transcription domain-associated protein
MKTLQQHLVVLNDSSAKDEAKLKAAQELSDNLDVALSSPQYPQFLETALRVFLKVLQVRRTHPCAYSHLIKKLFFVA